MFSIFMMSYEVICKLSDITPVACCRNMVTSVPGILAFNPLTISNKSSVKLTFEYHITGHKLSTVVS